MKISAITLIVITTILLFTIALFAAVNLPFSLFFYLTMAGEILFIFTVFRVLRDDYKTDKTFSDFYEDHPIGREFAATRGSQETESGYDN